QQELRKASLVDLWGQFSTGLREDGGSALDQLNRPLEVIGAVILRFQCPKQCVVIEPACILTTKVLVGRLQVASRPRIEFGPDHLEQPIFELNDLIVVDGPCEK